MPLVDLSMYASQAVLKVHTPDQNAEVHQAKKIKSERFVETASQPSSVTVSTTATHENGVWRTYAAVQFSKWLQKIVRLNENCRNIPSEPVIKLAIELSSKCMNHGALEQNCTSAGFTIRSVMAAALWVAIKFVGPRAVLPGTSFMVTALDVRHVDLTTAEIHVLQTNDWDIFTIALRAGVCI